MLIFVESHIQNTQPWCNAGVCCIYRFLDNNPIHDCKTAGNLPSAHQSNPERLQLLYSVKKLSGNTGCFHVKLTVVIELTATHKKEKEYE
jgi:hypothetical protein